VTENARPETTLILGVGNIIMGDEGFGVHVARALKSTGLPTGVRVEEGGVGGFNLLGLLDGIKRVIVIDAMNIDLPPGAVRLFGPVSNPGRTEHPIISFHQVGIPELARLWGLLYEKAEVYFLVTAPQTLAWSTELSTAVQEAAVKAAGLINELCQENFSGLGKETVPCTR
jgi:hydrogenase maturation protease